MFQVYRDICASITNNLSFVTISDSYRYILRNISKLVLISLWLLSLLRIVDLDGRNIVIETLNLHWALILT